MDNLDSLCWEASCIFRIKKIGPNLDDILADQAVNLVFAMKFTAL